MKPSTFIPTAFIRFLKKRLFNPEEVFRRIYKKRNFRYDLEIVEIIKRMKSPANCVDVGAHKGLFIGKYIELFPAGRHFSFEPIPDMYEDLIERFGKEASVYPYALSDREGVSRFHHVPAYPGYSGLRRRKYVDDDTEVRLIEVETRRMDDVIPEGCRIDFIKIDVEGAEMFVLKGAERIIQRSKPIIVFEFGHWTVDSYQITAEDMYAYFTNLGYEISLMEYYLRDREGLSEAEFSGQVSKRYNFTFVAYPI